MRWISNIC